MNSALDPSASTSSQIDRIIASDWHFADARTQDGVHGIHPYPARFIPQIPRRLIQLLTPSSHCVVFDPFCGSGTTLVEAQAAGHTSIGVDLNPIATLIARAKTRRPEHSAQELAARVVLEARRRQVPNPSIPRVDHWFSRDVQQALAGVAHAISDLDDADARDDLRVALSRIIVRVSFQDGDTRYAAVHKEVSAKLVFDLFERAALEIDKARAIHFNTLFGGPLASVRVLTSDILSVQPEAIGDVDLVVTSPPYPNAYEYWLYHKYRMYWLGYDPIAVREAEIGARPHFFKKNHHTAFDFQRQMSAVFALLSQVVRPQGHACFVVGSSRIHGKIVDNLKLLVSAASTCGFRLLAVVQRRVPATRKGFNPANSRATGESIAVFGK